ncbi:hypothetical protein F3Y22_tig00112343pilonHSYRG00121 [Hibiscus syriacus]|uniref:Uncharacterized protein n=1 Tax=Hibiscus syriacus TaxID=106335 RepID=A0A6A2Y645_HIBSY|nr:hypothetical protein F3Y22_tig00112343pilonHSYRG00121 [Hibiscus syriacus]
MPSKFSSCSPGTILMCPKATSRLCRETPEDEIRRSDFVLEQLLFPGLARSGRGRVRVQPSDGRSYDSM